MFENAFSPSTTGPREQAQVISRQASIMSTFPHRGPFCPLNSKITFDLSHLLAYSGQLILMSTRYEQIFSMARSQEEEPWCLSRCTQKAPHSGEVGLDGPRGDPAQENHHELFHVTPQIRGPQPGTSGTHAG